MNKHKKLTYHYKVELPNSNPEDPFFEGLCYDIDGVIRSFKAVLTGIKHNHQIGVTLSIKIKQDLFEELGIEKPKTNLDGTEG